MSARSNIYEVFRACRLCGGGGGYKMPIVTLDEEFDMRHKIKECVRLEVHQDDKMPPLVCELCVDKVNDYFEFLQMCRSTDTRTRQRLGLPQASALSGTSDGGDCILGVTEPVFVEDEDSEPLARQKNKVVLGGKSNKKSQPPPPPSKTKKTEPTVPVLSISRSGSKDTRTGLKELRVTINGTEGGPSRSESRSSRGGRRRSPTPPPAAPVTRRADKNKEKEPPKPVKDSPKPVKESPKPVKESPKTVKEPPKPAKPLRGVLKSPAAAPSIVTPPKKLLGKRELPAKQEPPSKRVRIAPKPPPPRKKSPPPRAEKRRAPSPPPRVEKKQKEAPSYTCQLCPLKYTKQQFLLQHLKTMHAVGFTSEKLACNPCGQWFTTAESSGAHHKRHAAGKPYACRRCSAHFKKLQSYNKHFASKQCLPSPELPDLKCEDCWSLYPTIKLMDTHECLGEKGRPEDVCLRCNKIYASRQSLRKHQKICGRNACEKELELSPELLRSVIPMQIRVARCDPLLARVKQEIHYDVSTVDTEFGLDTSCVYPYIASVRSIKREPLDEEVKTEDGVEYESYTDSDSEPELVGETEAPGSEQRLVANPFARKKKSVDALSTLSIKTIFSQRFLGRKKVLRKRKRRPIVKEEIKEEIETQETLVDEFEHRTDILNESYVRKTVDDLVASLDNDSTNNIEPEKNVVENSNKEESIGTATFAEIVIDRYLPKVTDKDLENKLNDNLSNDTTEDVENKANEESTESSVCQTTNTESSDKICQERTNDIQSESCGSKSTDVSFINDKGTNGSIVMNDTKCQDNNEYTISSETKELDIILTNEQRVENVESSVSEFQAKKLNKERISDEFDVNSMFSGDISANALRSTGQLIEKLSNNLGNGNENGNLKKSVDSIDDNDNDKNVEETEKSKGYSEQTNYANSLEKQEDIKLDEQKDTTENNYTAEPTNSETEIINKQCEDKGDSYENNKIDLNNLENESLKEIEDKNDVKEEESEIDNVHNEMNKEKVVVSNKVIAPLKTLDNNKDIAVVNPTETVSEITPTNTTESEKKVENEDDFLEDLDDVSDTDMDDSELMKEIDAQIDDKPTDGDKISLNK